MSILIKGIDMPSEGDNIHIIITSNGNYGLVSSKNFDIGFRKAIQIPKGHGRLIDEKELLDKIKQGQYSEDINQVIYSVGADDIYNAPTILESEE